MTDSCDIPLSPTDRTTLRRGRARARTDRSELTDVLDSARICHLGVVVSGTPMVVPTVYGYDLDGPDRDGTLYLHGSVAARSLQEPTADICVTVTAIDGVVLARSAFNHSMNYRSAMIFGKMRAVDDVDERDRALRTIVDRLIPGRTDAVRPSTRKELAATRVVALSLHEASVKVRRGDPADDASDVQVGGVWAGVLPIGEVVGEAVPAGDLDRVGLGAGGYELSVLSRA